MTVKEAITAIQHTCNEDSAAAIWLMSWITGKTYTELLINQHIQLSEHEEAALHNVITEIRDKHKPLQYILGSVPFLSLTITVRPPILIPRPETEYWCSWLIKQLEPVKNSNLTVLDLCTGSGCIALSLAQALPQSIIYATDISPTACKLTEENAHKNGIENVRIIEADLYHNLLEHSFDLIVSNPPYISAQEWEMVEKRVKEWEDPKALLAEDDGLALIKKIVASADQYLKKESLLLEHGIPQLLIEIGYAQGAAVRHLIEEAGFNIVAVHQDQGGKDRFVTGTRKRGFA